MTEAVASAPHSRGKRALYWTSVAVAGVVGLLSALNSVAADYVKLGHITIFTIIFAPIFGGLTFFMGAGLALEGGGAHVRWYSPILALFSGFFGMVLVNMLCAI